MFKTVTAACVLTTALAATSLAQTGTSDSVGAQPPTAAENELSVPAQTNQKSDSTGASTNVEARYITENRPDLWRASRLIGMMVYNEQDESIGDISEVLLNRQGQVEAVVIGVGGFLGIGERSVAIPFDSLQWQMTQPAADRGPAPQAPDSAPGQIGDDTVVVRHDRPERIVLTGATKDQLSNAPEFRYAR